MRYPVLFSLILVCLAVLALVTAQGGSLCGPDAGSCVDGNCCSSAGFCGITSLHCGSGCQPAYGTCSGGGSLSPSPSATTVYPIVSPTAISPSPSSTTSSMTITDAPTRTRHTHDDPSPTESTTPTFQLQPTGKPSAALSAQDTGVRSTVALVVVFFAGLMMA